MCSGRKLLTPDGMCMDYCCAYFKLDMQADLSDINLTPREVVERLDKYIVGQVSLQFDYGATRHLSFEFNIYFADMHLTSTFQEALLWIVSFSFALLQPEAKRAVANALRNRWRRHKIKSPMKVATAYALLLIPAAANPMCPS